MSEKFRKSEEMLQRALRTIPLGSQTFSKSLTQYPYGVSPFFLTHGKGCRVWDVDGNEFIDLVNSLCAITLGYNDPDVDAAVSSQLDKGVVFSLPHPLEMQVAEKIVEMVPCAEMVRFGKNGSDVTAGAIRLARAYTGRDHVAVCGYHGWQDWYIGSTSRALGVPKATRNLTHSFTYNDIGSLEQLFKTYKDRLAAVILEPVNIAAPQDSFLEKVRDITHKNGSLLVFDEIITGFRLAKGGAQELYGITPDLATFGKGMANGFPISAIAGKAIIMQLFEEVFFSFTFGGETLSLAASLATLTKLQNEPIIEKLDDRGTKLLNGINLLLNRYELTDFLSTAGPPPWSFLMMKKHPPYSIWEIKTLFMQEMLARGILTFGTHNLSYAHSDNDIMIVLEAYDQVLQIMKNAVHNRRMLDILRCKPLKPLFKVR